MKNSHISLILASSSPRRRDLLAQIGITPEAIVSPSIDESVISDELPKDYAQRIALAKAKAVHAFHPNKLILAADTVVVCGRRILPKAEDVATAYRCLQLLSGRRHRVLGALCIIDQFGKIHTSLEQTTVTFKRLDRKEIKVYIEEQEWQGKAGGYAIQGNAACFVKSVHGCYFNIVGLPLYRLKQMLRSIGVIDEVS